MPTARRQFPDGLAAAMAPLCSGTTDSSAMSPNSNVNCSTAGPEQADRPGRSSSTPSRRRGT
eukprot:14467618-Alexandrium_andersonii.AAC.1